MKESTRTKECANLTIQKIILSTHDDRDSKNPVESLVDQIVLGSESIFEEHKSKAIKALLELLSGYVGYAYITEQPGYCITQACSVINEAILIIDKFEQIRVLSQKPDSLSFEVKQIDEPSVTYVDVWVFENKLKILESLPIPFW